MSDFLERNGLQTVAQHFKDLFLAGVHRDGAEELLERLENETDFFEAPAGAKHHGAFPGGLVIHSLNVYRRLREITIRDLTPRDALGHGEKSLYQIARFIRLEDHEALAIRWHMGAYDTAARTDLRDLSAAMDATPWVWRLHEADMCAAHIDERGTDE